MQWFIDNFSYIAELTGYHLVQAILPLVLGVIIAVPVAQAARLSKPLGGVILTTSALLYTVPSLAMFVLLPLVLGTQVLDMINVIVALTIYAVALLVRSTLDALNSIDDGVRQAAVAMGFTPLRRFLTVDLPLSIPVLFAGLRVISVTNISLVSVGALIGIPSLGTLFTDGLFRSFPTVIVIGIVVTLVLALVMDLMLVLLERLLTPWARLAKVTADPMTVTNEANLSADASRAGGVY
ncbi:ABC transporter permease [Arthrobacter sp. Soil782]|uniref:ABC transporter permease n=1 Tax=Arthrobacter sp. Soil782 TaxID=1736410 RepID=UPI0006FB56C0|nr:ABC transporter permease [Arthrobacter sp. Soil782]KRF08503.1 ABC transporter permease [Arthrobacter sp. Soil782]